MHAKCWGLFDYLLELATLTCSKTGKTTKGAPLRRRARRPPSAGPHRERARRQARVHPRSEGSTRHFQRVGEGARTECETCFTQQRSDRIMPPCGRNTTSAACDATQSDGDCVHRDSVDSYWRARRAPTKIGPRARRARKVDDRPREPGVVGERIGTNMWSWRSAGANNETHH